MIKARLNKLRELALIFFSLMLWIFSLLAFVTVIFTLLGVELYYVQLIRTILKITRSDLMSLIMASLIVGITIIIYLSITYYFGPFKKEVQKQKKMKKQSKIRLTIFVILSILSLSSIGVEAKEEQTETNERLDYQENSVLALNYHRVRDVTWLDRFLLFFSNPNELKRYSVSTDEFQRQMNWLIDHDAHFLTLDELLKYKEEGQFPKRSVWINFDDMDHTIYDNAFPILKNLDIPATGFVITGQVGNSNFSDMKMINNNELTEMYQTGLWDFASHTDNLHYLDDKNRSLLIQEKYSTIYQDFQRSNQYLKEQWDIDNQALAYPYGGGNDTVSKALEKTGIKYGFTLEENVITPDLNDQYLPRILMNEDSFERLIESWKGFESDESN